MPLSGTMKPKPFETSNHLMRPATSMRSSGRSGAASSWREVSTEARGVPAPNGPDS